MKEYFLTLIFSHVQANNPNKATYKSDWKAAYVIDLVPVLHRPSCCMVFW